jgi:hypothetical protein
MFFCGTGPRGEDGTGLENRNLDFRLRVAKADLTEHGEFLPLTEGYENFGHMQVDALGDGPEPQTSRRPNEFRHRESSP